MNDLARTADSASPVAGRFALFDYGFRPFFLLAGLSAFAIVPVWLYFYAHQAVPFGALPAMYWHSHEMLYGFVVAAIAGFLLTAVPSWTGTRGFAGAPLFVLVCLWLAGRVAMAVVGDVPFWVTAIGAASPSSGSCTWDTHGCRSGLHSKRYGCSAASPSP